MHCSNFLKVKVCLCLIIFFVMTAYGQWYFMPNYHLNIPGIEKETSGDIPFWKTIPLPIKEHVQAGKVPVKQQAKLTWRPAAFPHRDYVKVMRGRNVYGWYGCEFDVPGHCRHLDIEVNLGIIDDTDETFLNGQKIGGVGELGKPHGTAWKTERSYVAPTGILREKGNFLASHVWNLWGLGGIVGPPYVRALLASSTCDWKVAGISEKIRNPHVLNQAERLQEVMAMCFPDVQPAWQDATGSTAEHQDEFQYSLYKISLDQLEKGLKSVPEKIVLDLGLCPGVAVFFLNDKRIGQIGRFASSYSPAVQEISQRMQLELSGTDLNQASPLELTAIIFKSKAQKSGLEKPGIVIHPHEKDDSDTLTKRFQILLNSRKADEAEKLLKRMRPDTEAENVWLLSHKMHLAYMQWFDGGGIRHELMDAILADAQKIFSQYPHEAPRQSAMQVFCHVLRSADKNNELLNKVRKYFPHYRKKCVYMGDDRKTRGDWLTHYGKTTFVLAGMGQITDWAYGVRHCSYDVKVPGNRDYARYWLAQENRNLSHPAALVMPSKLIDACDTIDELKVEHLAPVLFPGERIRRASWWDDHGEMHPFDDEGPNLDLLLSPKLKNFTMTVSMHDFDWRETRFPRQHSLVVFDQQHQVVNACWSGVISEGVFERFRIEDMQEVRIRCNKHRSACVAVSGFYIDEPISLQETLPILNGDVSEKVINRYYELLECDKYEQEKVAKEIIGLGRELLCQDAGALGLYIYVVAKDLIQHHDGEEIMVLRRLCEMKSADGILDWLSAVHNLKQARMLWKYYAIVAIGNLLKVTDEAYVEEIYNKLWTMNSGFMHLPLQKVCLNSVLLYGGKNKQALYERMKRQIPQKVQMAR